MTKKIKWWVWAGVGLIIILIAFKMLNHEQFTKAPLGGRRYGSEYDDKIMKKVLEVRDSFGYPPNPQLEYRLRVSILGIESKRIEDLYDQYGEKITKDQLVKAFYTDPRSPEEWWKTKFSELTQPDDIQFINILHEYLTNYPPIPIDQPVSLVRLV